MPTTKVTDQQFAVRPHPKAPILSNADDAKLHIQQLITEMSSPNPQLYGEVFDLVKEACYVNLFFFLRYICAYAGPYDKLNDTLHLDMCNFRQSDYCMNPGARAGAFIPRSFLKSTIFTHGANTWEILRNPNIRIAIINATRPRAESFMHNIERNFDMNSLLGFLFPNYVPSAGHKRWNDTEMVCPARTKHSEVPTVQPLGATAAAEGVHVDLENIDDICGIEELDREHQANASMDQRRRWWDTNTKAVLLDWATSRIMCVATLYAVDDPYYQNIITQNMYRLVGYQDPEMVDLVRPDLSPDEERWTVYYRSILEDGEAIYPDGGFTKGAFEVLLRDKPWTAMTQYMNKPTASGLTEFHQMEAKSCRLSRDKTNTLIILPEDNQPVRVCDCDVVMTIDPAGTDKGITAKTSRTSIGVWAMDYGENVYRIWSRVGYFSILDTFDMIFEGQEYFGGLIRATYVESNAMQTIIAPLLEEEQFRRGRYINPEPIAAKGDKIARIRNNVGLALANKKLYLAEGCGTEFREEMRVFPMQKYRMDVLDESEKALTALQRPMSPNQRWAYEEQDERYRSYTTENCVGY